MLVDRRSFLTLLAAAPAVALLPERPRPAAGHAAPVTATRRGDPWIELDRARLLWNLRQIQARVGQKRVMAVVKANGYGHGLVEVSKALEAAGVAHFLVGKLDEARELRKAGVRGQVLNFGPFADSDAEEIIRLGITQSVYTDQVTALDRAARRLERQARVQIKVDTGLGRLGAHHAQAAEFLERVLAMPGVVVEGVFTTLTEEPDFDAVQLARLKQLRGVTQRAGKQVMFHAASSAAIADLPAAYAEFDMVRPGIMLYGLYPSQKAEQERKLDLKPVLALKARVVQVKTLQPGESVSYHRAFTATLPERVATLAVGYSDGLPRALAGKGAVLIAGQRCSILAISANATIVRLGAAPAAIGDEAVLIGSQRNETMPASEVATLTAGSVYAVAMGMSPFLPRVVI